MLCVFFFNVYICTFHSMFFQFCRSWVGLIIVIFKNEVIPMCEGREKFTVRDTRIDPFWGMKDFEVELLKCVRPRKVER